MSSQVSSEDILDKVKAVLEEKIVDVTFQISRPKTITDLNKPIVVCSQIDTKEGTVGIGSVIGTKTLDMFQRANVKAMRIDCTLIFDVWAGTIDEVNGTAREVVGLIMAEQNGELRREGILKIGLTKTDVVETETLPSGELGFFAKEEEAYRKRLYFETTGELTFPDIGDARGDITGIEVGVKLDEEGKEEMTLERAKIEEVNYDRESHVLTVIIRNKSRVTLVYRGLRVIDSLTAEESFSDPKLNENEGISSRPGEVKTITELIESPPLATDHQYVLRIATEKGAVASHTFTA